MGSLADNAANITAGVLKKNRSGPVDRHGMTTAIVFAFAFVVLAPVNWLVPYDFYEYMTRAVNIATGEGYANLDNAALTDRAPLYSLLLAAVRLAFGPDIYLLALFQGVCGALNVTFAYLLGRELFSGSAGLFTAATICASGLFHPYLVNHIDPAWSLSLMISVYILMMSCRSGSRRLSAAAGLAFGLSFLIKEATLVLTPLPFLALFLFQSKPVKERLLDAATAYLTILAVISPWAFYVLYISGQDLTAMLGAYGATVVTGGAGAAKTGLVEKAVRMGWGFFRIWYDASYNNSLAFVFYLAPVYFAGWVYVLWRSLRGDVSFRFLLLLLVCLAPFVMVVGSGQLRLGQLNFLILLSIISFSAAIVDIANRLPLKPSTAMLVALFTLTMALGAEISFGPGDGYIREHFKTLARSGFADKLVKPRTGRLAQFISHTLKPEESVFATDLRTGKMLFWDMEASRRLNVMEFTVYDYYKNQVKFNYSKDAMKRRRAPVNTEGIPISVSGSFTRGTPVVFIKDEESFLKQVSSFDYIVVNHPWENLKDYLEKSPAFRLVTTVQPESDHPFFGRPFYVYSIDKSSLRPLEQWRPIITDNVRALVGILAKRDPVAFSWYVNKLEEAARGRMPEN